MDKHRYLSCTICWKTHAKRSLKTQLAIRKRPISSRTKLKRPECHTLATCCSALKASYCISYLSEVKARCALSVRKLHADVEKRVKKKIFQEKSTGKARVFTWFLMHFLAALLMLVYQSLPFHDEEWGLLFLSSWECPSKKTTCGSRSFEIFSEMNMYVDIHVYILLYI